MTTTTTSFSARRSLAFAGLVTLTTLLGASTGCTKPDPPRIVPKEVRVVSIGPQGLDLLVKVEATNPNSITLSAQSMTGKAKLDGKYEMGTVTIAKPVVLPPNNVPTIIDVPMTMPWTDLKVLTTLATVQRPVPYVVEGSVKIGGERLNVDVPFSIAGTITRDQIANAALKGLPPLPAGIKLPQ